MWHSKILLKCLVLNMISCKFWSRGNRIYFTQGKKTVRAVSDDTDIEYASRTPHNRSEKQQLFVRETGKTLNKLRNSIVESFAGKRQYSFKTILC